MSLSWKKSFTVGVALVAVVLAGNAFSQEDDARIPFVVNANATVSASRGSNEISMSVENGVEKIMTIPAGMLVSIRHGSANRQPNVANLRVDSRGNLNLNLPQSNYQNATFSLYSLNGRRVMHTNINTATSNFSRSHVAPGAYMLSVKGTDGNSFTSRFTHRGGAMNVNVFYGAFSNSESRRETATFLTSGEEWDIRVRAAGYADSVYTLAIVSGDNPRQEITLRCIAEQNCPDDIGRCIVGGTCTNDIKRENCVGRFDYLIACVWNPNITYGSFTDSRDSKTYLTVEMPDGKTWMAENLNYRTSNGSWCYDHETSNCNIYGRLYDWAAAMGCDDVFCGGWDIQGVCPNGWRMPSDADWITLMTAIGDSAGRHLKAQIGWEDCGPVGSDSNGVCDDTYGFSALPGGERDGSRSLGLPPRYSGIGGVGYWWTATQLSSTPASAQYWTMYNVGTFSESLLSGQVGKERGFSVRCVKDD